MTQDLDFRAITTGVADYIARTGGSNGGGGFEEEFNDLSLRLFRLQYDRVRPYREFCERRGMGPGRVTRWQDIPALPVAAFKEQEITSLTPGARTRVFYSSGTTGRTCSRHFHDANSLGLYEASLLAWFEANLLADGAASAAGMDLVVLTPEGQLAPHSSLVHMFETVAGGFPWGSSWFGAGVDAGGNWILDLAAVRSRLERAEGGGRPALLLGTAFSYVHLLDYLEEENAALRLPAGSLALETGGYKGKSREYPREELHAWLGRRLGLGRLQIISEYGMSELGSQAYDLKAGDQEGGGTERGFRFPPWARARIISPETGREAARGQPGMVAILDLANVRSCLAVQTEDLGVGNAAGWQILGRARVAEPRGCSLMPA